ncbi:3-ketoacyl-acyl carrier protein reductase, partial [Hyaloscypha variabilis F]
LPLEGKTALVTGGNRGIGAGIAYELAKRGADIIITHRSGGSLELSNRISALAHKPRLFDITGDLSSPDSPALIISTAIQWLKNYTSSPKIDILVNNAGVKLVKPLGEITPQDFATVYDVNVRGTLLLTQAVLPLLPPRGRIINISSVGSRVGFAGLGLYCSSKAAIEGLTRCWAAELGGNGTTVNAVSPGPVESEMLRNIPREIVEGQKRETPLEKRVGTVEEVAGVVAWLAGEDGRWVTGQTISASGGWAMY